MRLNKKKNSRDSVEAYACICLDASCSCNCSCSCICQSSLSQAEKNNVALRDSNASYNSAYNTYNPALANQAVM